MVDEVLREVDRISRGKTKKNILTICYVYFIRILISLLPTICLWVLTFIGQLFSRVLGADGLYVAITAVSNFAGEIITFVAFLLTSPFLFGGLNYYLNEALENDKDESLNKYLSNAKLSFKEVWMILRLFLGTFFGLILFIVPGAIFFANRIMAPFVLIENENMSVSEAFAESKKIMGNRKNELIHILIRLLIAPLTLYIIGTFIMQFGFIIKFIGAICYIAAIVMTLVALSKVFLALPLLYLKIKGRKAGAIDVDFREV